MSHMTPLELRTILEDLENRATAATGLAPCGRVVGPWHMVRWLKGGVHRWSWAPPFQTGGADGFSRSRSGSA